MRRRLKWLAAVGLAVWGLSALAGHLPPRLRLLLLFSIGFGSLIGWSAGVIADEIGVVRTRWSAGMTLVLTVAGLANMSFTAYRQLEAAARASVEKDSQQLLALRVLETAMADDPELQQRYLEERGRVQPTFGDYITGRLSQVGRPSSPWPAVIWGTEILLGGVAAAWIFRRPSRAARNQTLEEKSETQNPKSETPESNDNHLSDA